MKSWSEKNKGKLDPKKITLGSSLKPYWKCLKNTKHPHWQTSVAHRYDGHGCPVCSKAKQGNRGKLPSVANSKLFASWSEKNKGTLDPTKITLGSNAKAFWKCLNNTEHPHWQASVVRRKLGKGCPACTKEERGSHPSIADSELYASWSEKNKGLFDPKKISLGSNLKPYWKCVNNPDHPHWQARVDCIAQVVSRKMGTGCPACAKEKRLKLPSVANSKLYASWSEKNKGMFDPKKITLGSKTKAFWKCLKNIKHPHWQASVNNIHSGTGCPACSRENKIKN